MDIKNVEACSFSRDGFKPHVKAPVIWGHKGNTIFPLCYLQKPKSMSQSDWNSFLDGFSFEIKKPKK